jgi:hypothetical protein
VFAPPSLVEHLEAVLQAAEALGRPQRGPKSHLMVERAVAGACAAVYFDLKHKRPTTSHPKQRSSPHSTPDPYHDLVKAVFTAWGLDYWQARAVEVAEEWHAALRGYFAPNRQE